MLFLMHKFTKIIPHILIDAKNCKFVASQIEKRTVSVFQIFNNLFKKAIFVSSLVTISLLRDDKKMASGI